MSTTVQVFTKAEAYPWFCKELEGVGLGRDGLADAWDAAWTEFERQGAQAEPWRGWVRMCVQGSRSHGVKNPAGVLLKRLRGGSADDLAAPLKFSKAAAQEVRNRECDAYVEKAREERAALPKEKLSLVAGMHAHRMGINVHEMMREWERQGCPTQTEFDFPGWGRCLELAGVAQ